MMSYLGKFADIMGYCHPFFQEFLNYFNLKHSIYAGNSCTEEGQLSLLASGLQSYQEQQKTVWANSVLCCKIIAVHP